MKQILLNMRKRRQVHAHGGIWVPILKDEEDLRFDVRDTGNGIRQSDLDSIWEIYGRWDQSRTREFGGTGLGLSITASLWTPLAERVCGECLRQRVYLHCRTAIKSVVRPDDTTPRRGEVPRLRRPKR